MKKGILGIIILVMVVGGSIGIYFWQIDQKKKNQTPTLILPYSDSSHLTYIQGFGNVSQAYYHVGIDFGFNDTVTIYAAASGQIRGIKYWYNAGGGHWQTNVDLYLNNTVQLQYCFESWATTEDNAKLQFAEIVAKKGSVKAGDIIGKLLYHGENCHIHFTILVNNSDWVCPYPYFTPEAKATFDTQFATLAKQNGSKPCN